MNEQTIQDEIELLEQELSMTELHFQGPLPISTGTAVEISYGDDVISFRVERMDGCGDKQVAILRPVTTKLANRDGVLEFLTRNRNALDLVGSEEAIELEDGF